MFSFGFSTRHWQQIEAGRPITLKTLLRICDVFEITPEKLLRGLYLGVANPLLRRAEPRIGRKEPKRMATEQARTPRNLLK
jgi:transcriptional regulator with XRE-family HTH domain